MYFFIGLLFLAAGIGMVVKTEWIIQNFGSSEWAEQKMGTSGGTRLLYKLIGFAMIFIAFLLITNMLNGFLMGTVGRVLIR